jgi:hypothetical protein
MPHSQIQELLQFITDEKEVQKSLQDLASQLTGDVESLKIQHQGQPNIGTPMNGNFIFLTTTTHILGRSNSTYANTPLTTTDNGNKGWGSRRMAKQSKYGRFEAQQQLEAEQRARQHVTEELRRQRIQNDENTKLIGDLRKRVQQSEHIERENQILRDRMGKELNLNAWNLERFNEQQRMNADKNSPSSPNIMIDPRYNAMQRYNPAFLSAIASQSSGSEFYAGRELFIFGF